MGQEGNIVIHGKEKRGIVSAKSRIDIIVESARQKEPFTHFLSFPISSQQVKDAFQQFQAHVLRSCGHDEGVDESIFQNPHKLHLTIGTLTLLSESEIATAKELLQTCSQDIIRCVLDEQPLLCRVQGLEYMNDDPGSVDVLYAKIEPHSNSHRLQEFTDSLVDRFVAAGLMKRDFNNVKLHITVMNTLFRKEALGASSRGRQDNRRPARESFNASNLISAFGEYNFGDAHIREVHLSQRYSTSQDGYYVSASTITLP